MIHVEREATLAIVTLDRPPMNAMDIELLEELTAAIESAVHGDGAAGAVVITGGDRCFSAGLDLKVIPNYDPEQQCRLIGSLNRMVAAIYGLPRPVVAAMGGHALAGGLILALCADYRLAAEGQAKIGLAEIRAGVPFPVGPLELVRAELSPGAARLLALTGRNLTPSEALAAGVVDEVVPGARLMDRAREIAVELAALPAETFATIKGQLRREPLERIERAVRTGDDPMLERWLGDETRGAARRALGKDR